MLSVGEISINQDLEKFAEDSSRSPDYPFALAGELTRSSDLVFGSLETSLDSFPSTLYSSSQTNSLENDSQFKAALGYAKALKKAGFNFLAFGGNNSFDYGLNSVLRTVKSLNEAGIEVAGAGENPEATLYFEKNGLKLALVSASQGIASDNKNAGFYMAQFDSSQVLNRIREARRQADVVIVLLHWRDGDKTGPSNWRQDWVSQASLAGADLILGFQPDGIGPFEVINHRTVVAYSLGTFLPDNRFASSTQESVGLYLKLDKGGVASAEAIPLKIEGGRPRALQDQEREQGLRLLSQNTGKTSAFQATAIYWNGTGWATGPGLSYQRDASQPGKINLPLNRVIEVQDLSGDQGGYSTTRVTGDNNLAEQQTTPERIELKEGRLTVWRPVESGWELTFESPPQWQVKQFAFGDADEDGRPELIFSLWKSNGPDDKGLNRSHPFVYGWRRGAFRPVWAGSALADPIREFALGDFKGNGHNELVVLEGNYDDAQDAPARYVTVWQWNGWGYELLYRSTQGSYYSLAFIPGQPYAFFKQNP